MKKFRTVIGRFRTMIGRRSRNQLIRKARTVVTKIGELSVRMEVKHMVRGNRARVKSVRKRHWQDLLNNLLAVHAKRNSSCLRILREFVLTPAVRRAQGLRLDLGLDMGLDLFFVVNGNFATRCRLSMKTPGRVFVSRKISLKSGECVARSSSAVRTVRAFFRS